MKETEPEGHVRWCGQQKSGCLSPELYIGLDPDGPPHSHGGPCAGRAVDVALLKLTLTNCLNPYELHDHYREMKAMWIQYVLT